MIIVQKVMVDMSKNKYKHFIFDMGNVLMDFNPKYILSNYFDDVDSINKYYTYYFASGLWGKLDNGDISFEELIEDIDQSSNKDKDKLRKFITTWQEHKWERTGMTKIVKKLSDKGYGIHLCSNAADKFYTYKDQYSVFEYFDSILISADYKTSKPGEEIYKLVLEKNKLNPEECLFIDDLGENIRAAEALGMDGYQYNGNEAMFEKFLRNIKIL